MRVFRISVGLLTICIVAITMQLTRNNEPEPSVEWKIKLHTTDRHWKSDRDFTGDRDDTKAHPSSLYWEQRAYPHDSIPQDQLILALEQAQEMRASYLASGQSMIDPGWVLAGPTNRPGRVVAVAVHPSDPATVYAGSAQGGVYKSTDYGQDWVPIFDDVGILPIGAITIDPTDPQIIYVGTGEPSELLHFMLGNGVYKSTDGGTTWTHLGLSSSGTIGRIIVDSENPARVFVAAQGKLRKGTSGERGVYRSEDGGTTWDRVLYVNVYTGCVDLAFHSSSGVMLAATWQYPTGTGSGIWRSADRGNTWTNISGTYGLPVVSSLFCRTGITMGRNHTTAYASYCAGPGKIYAQFYGLYKSTDLGLTWTRTNDSSLDQAYHYDDGIHDPTLAVGWYFPGPQVSPTDPNTVYHLGISLYRSTDGGDNWFQIPCGYGGIYGSPHVDHHDLCFLEASDDAFYVGGDGGVYYTDDQGGSWAELANMANTQFYAIEIDHTNPQRLYGGTQDMGVAGTISGAADEWVLVYPADGGDVIVDYTDSNTIYVQVDAPPHSIFKSEDFGASFRRTNTGISDSDPACSNRAPIVMSLTNPKVLYFGTNRLYRTVDGAENWDPISSSLSSWYITAIGLSPVDDQVVYAGCATGEVWGTTNGGDTWTRLDYGLPDYWVTAITVDPYNPAIAYVTLSGYIISGTSSSSHIFRTDDYGQAWAAISGNLPVTPINDVIVDCFNDSTLYVGTDVGVFRTMDLGATWTPYGTGMPIASVIDLDYHAITKTLVAATHGRSVFRIITECNDSTDSDGDGVCDAFDNCPSVPNADQIDADLDMLGDACDDCFDTDKDGYGNPGYANSCPDDNCPETYNPDQADSDNDGVGDACFYAPLQRDLIRTDCTRLDVVNGGAFGYYSRGSLDYSESGDCGLYYIFAASCAISYRNDLGETVAPNSWNGAQGFFPINGYEETMPTETTADYDTYRTGTMITEDSVFALEMTWWAPKQPENCHFVIQQKKLCRFNDDSISSVSVGDFVDWDIPNSPVMNQGGYDSAYGLIYQYGGPSENPADDCRNNTHRFGAVAMISSYTHLHPHNVDTTPHSGAVQSIRPPVFDDTISQSYLYSVMHLPGYSVSSATDDLFSCMTYSGDVSLQPDDTLYVYSAFISLLDGTTGDLREQVELARSWTADHLGVHFSCCGLYTSGYTGNTNCSTDGLRSLSDISRLIDYLYISKQPLCCPPSGNTNGSEDGSITLSDVSRLIDHVYISKQETVQCP